MHCTRKLTDAVTWVGGSDRRLVLFENLFPIPRGVAYNSYLIMDEKTALMDTVDRSISRQFLENVTHELGGRGLDYLVVDHMEPDHCANIEALMLHFPNMKLVGNEKTFALIRQFYGLPLEGRGIVVKDGDTLALGRHTLRFFFTPMVHWPEVMMAYEESEKILFSADAFGSFGALNGNLFEDELDFERDWLADARRYYGNIVGKYGPQVAAALNRLAPLDIRLLCPLHGPVWRRSLQRLLGYYSRWCRYEPDERAVAVFYGSMYGNTENAADILANGLAQAGVKNIAVYDVSSTHVSVLVGEIFRCSHLVLAAPTYNNGVYPAMLGLLHDMKALNLQNRTVGLVQNGSWAPASGRQMQALLDEMKDMRMLQPVVTLRSALDEASMGQLMALKDTLAAQLLSDEQTKTI